MRARFSKTVLVVDESSLASSEQMRGLLKATTALRVPRVVLVGDEKQLGAVEAGKPLAQLEAAGMRAAVMDEILRKPSGQSRRSLLCLLLVSPEAPYREKLESGSKFKEKILYNSNLRTISRHSS